MLIIVNLRNSNVTLLKTTKEVNANLIANTLDNPPRIRAATRNGATKSVPAESQERLTPPL